MLRRLLSILRPAQSANPPRAHTVLFLDFDGVLSPGNTGTLRDADKLAVLLDEFEPVEIVLSTTWREYESLEQLLGWLPAALARRVIGVTPVLPDGREAGGRQREIEAWLQAHRPLRWLALDDTASLFNPGCPWLFLTSSRDALDAPTLLALRHRLQELRQAA